MNFLKFKKEIQENFKVMTANVSNLFEVEMDKDEIIDVYLKSFPEGTNPIFRERTEHDCSCCKSFIRNIGNVITIEDGKIKTIWDFKAEDSNYQIVANKLNEYILSKAVSNLFITKEKSFGTDKNYEVINGKSHEWQHFYLELDKKFISNSKETIDSIKGSNRDVRNVFKRSLDEITIDSVMTVLELISQNSLYKGEEWKFALTEFLKYKKTYDLSSNKEIFAWENFIKAGSVVGKIKNHSIGTLLMNISESMDLDLAVKKYEQIAAPTNYKRSNPIYTKQMLEKAQQKIEELGYMDSLPRRFATLDDITVNNILFSNKDSAKRIQGNIFDDMSNSIAINPKQFSKVEEVSIDKFIENILPTATNIEVLFENKHIPNLVSLIAPQNKDSKTMFKWNNNFGWAYKGNITDSAMKERVKELGGKVDGVFRFSLSWNDGDDNIIDFDAHCIEPNGNEISYSKKTGHSSTGMLDVDIITPDRGKLAVENITWSDINRMKEGTYKLFVRNFSSRKSVGGFKAEVEYDGEVHSFEYNNILNGNQDIYVAEVTLKNGEFTIKDLLESNSTISSKTEWNLKTNQFIPVSVMCLSPNYWDAQDGLGNRHFMFMLKECINNESPNGFYNEFLNYELNEHRKVMEALSLKLKVQDSAEQLSGIGFSSTKRAELTVRVTGVTTRVLKIKI